MLERIGFCEFMAVTGIALLYTGWVLGCFGGVGDLAANSLSRLRGVDL